MTNVNGNTWYLKIQIGYALWLSIGTGCYYCAKWIRCMRKRKHDKILINHTVNGHEKKSSDFSVNIGIEKSQMSAKS